MITSSKNKITELLASFYSWETTCIWAEISHVQCFVKGVGYFKVKQKIEGLRVPLSYMDH